MENEENIAKDGENSNQEEKVYSQQDVDEIVKNRLHRERKKYEGFEDYKKAAQSYSELEKSFNVEKEKSENLKKELDDLKQKNQIAGWKVKASEETGVNISLIKGNTEDEIMEHAKAIKDAYAYPQVKSNDNNPKGDDLTHTEQRFKGIYSALDSIG